MKALKKDKILIFVSILAGFVNGLFGAGGGIVTVLLFKKLGLSQANAQANAVAAILPISILSASLYLFKNHVEFNQALIYIPTGVLGALIGAYILKKISPVWLKRIFSIFMIYAGVRLLLR